MGAPICLPDYDERDRLEHIWCGGYPFGQHRGVFWKSTPVHEIREYMDEEIGFYFAWLELYCVWLKVLPATRILTLTLTKHLTLTLTLTRRV